MKANHKKNEKPKSDVGLRIIFSEKSFIALLHIILALGIVPLQFYNPVNREIHPRIFPDQID